MINLDLEHFRARVLQDGLTEATAQYWIHRAHQLQQAAPRVDEHHGDTTPEQLREAWRRCMDTAQACLNHADLIRSNHPEPISDEVWVALGEVA
jgi:hypothetical protein